jgi:xylulokinase
MSLLGLDIGTTGCKAIAFSVDGNIIAHSYREYGVIYPQPGWAELDPDKVWNCVKEVISEVAYKSRNDPIKALAVTSLGETFTPISKDGKALSNSMTYVDSRGTEQTESWKHTLGKERVFEITGQPLHPGYSLPKLMWLRDNRPEIFGKAHKFLLYEDFAIFKLGLEPVIDYSLAGRTMAFDVREKKWSEEMFKTAGINPDVMARPRPSGEVVGIVPEHIAEELGLPIGTKVVTGGHDQPVNALGGGVVSEGVAVDGMGSTECVTVAFNEPHINQEMLEGNFPVYSHVKKGMYVSLAFSYTGGNLLRWYRDNFARDMVKEARKTGVDVYDLILKDIPNAPTDIYILPHFVGSGTPYFDPDSKGVIAGLTLGTTRDQFVKALIEGVTYELRFNLETLEKAAGVKIDRLRAVGGGAKSPKWLQIKADITGKEVVSLKVAECGCLGAAILAGVGSGEYDSVDEAVEMLISEADFFQPDPVMHKQYNERFGIYSELYPTLREVVHRM